MSSYLDCPFKLKFSVSGWGKASTTEDLALVPRTHAEWLKTACDTSFKGSDALIWLASLDLLHMHGAHTSAQADIYINKEIFSKAFVLSFLYMSFEHAEDILYDQAPSSLHSFATNRYLKTLWVLLLMLFYMIALMSKNMCLSLEPVVGREEGRDCLSKGVTSGSPLAH